MWPSASPPPAAPALTWNLRDVAELPAVRAQLRRHTVADASDADALDQLVLALDEMASNALRHGGGEVRATVRLTDDAFLIEVSDQAATAPPTPAVLGELDAAIQGLGMDTMATASIARIEQTAEEKAAGPAPSR